MMPSGVVTFLFTDIEGSTRRWESDADAMRAALDAHDDVLRSAIEGNGGFLFKHTGDGVCAAFASPLSAVNAAVDSQRRLDLPVRMGVATGEADLRDGDYVGTVLNRAARVMAAGHGGQILVAGSTASLVRGVDLVDLGARRLRDLPDSVNLYQVRAAGLVTDFQPLRTLDPSPGNLRRSSTAFVGRDTEVADIAAALKSRRLVTLTGVGGVGKTRLAIEVAARLADGFADGVWVFELSAVNDPAAVPDSVAAILGTSQQPGKTMSESVAAALEGRVRLLVFDNCEHVLDAAADLAEAILTASTTVTILATSREGLALADEQVWPLRSLGIDAAADLFTERALHIAPTAKLDDATVVAEICKRLDGIPLAIELAAARMSSMGAEEIRDHLDHRFKFLTGSRRALGRHQTLRHAVAWSYDLLDDAEKQLLERCSVFAGGFDLNGACAVAGPDADRYVIVDLLDALVRKSLIVAEQSSGRTRFSMLETIREFADERLAADGDASGICDAHACYFAEQEAGVMALWNSPRQREAYEWFAIELANLRNAFRWAADRDQLDVAAQIATYAGVLGMAVENQEPSTWAEELIGAARLRSHPRLGYLYVVAALCWMAGRIEDAISYSDLRQEMVRNGCGDVPFGLDGLLGGTYMVIGEVDRALEWEDGYLDERSDPLVISRSNRVIQLTMAGRSDEAMAAAPEILIAAEATGNPYAVSGAFLGYGFAFRDADPDKALDVLRRGLVIAHSSANRATEGYLASNSARLQFRRGDIAAALDHLTQALHINRDSGSTTAIRSPLALLVEILDGLGMYEPAATISGFAVSALTETAFPELRTFTAHLGDVLGGDAYESLAGKGANMTTAAIAAFAFDQLERARTQLGQLR